MRILSQTSDMRGYHGTIGTPTNMYDYRGEQLFVGDVVCLVTFGVDGKKAYDFGIEFVCEENTSIANWTGKNHQYVMGIAEIYNSDNFKVLDGVEINSEEWGEKFYTIDRDFRVYKVKDHSLLAIGEKIGSLSVIDVAANPTKKERYIFSVKRYKEWCRQTGNQEYSWSYECDGCEIDPETSTVVGKNGKQYLCSINEDEDVRFPWYEVITEVD